MEVRAKQAQPYKVADLSLRTPQGFNFTWKKTAQLITITRKFIPENNPVDCMCALFEARQDRHNSCFGFSAW